MDDISTLPAYFNDEGLNLNIDPLHSEFNPHDLDIIHDVWWDKYKNGKEASPTSTLIRCVDGVIPTTYGVNTNRRLNIRAAMRNLLFIPGGRIVAGAGTDKIVTLLNCYVMRTIPDSLIGIMDVFKESALTMQQGGGIGLDFSTLRPSGAWLSRTQAEASGPLPFMDMWHQMCATMMSAGGRRGAMMAVMRCDHPDIMKFIHAKREAERLTNFNVSVLCTDKFMYAVKNDESWELTFNKRPATQPKGIDHRYIYETVRARDLWNAITESSYEHSEPGVIFIDRINEQNNLNYCEKIAATNPCGEQPLPPGGACDLGCINLARIVTDPFTDHARVNHHLLKHLAHIGVDFLDQVLDVTKFPLEIQAEEAKNKRRIGLGVTGLADMFCQLGLRYGSAKALMIGSRVHEVIAREAYIASAILAKERGVFPLYNANSLEMAPFIKKLPSEALALVKEYGLRNGVILTIAPTGTTSLCLAGNTSSGIEPIIAHIQDRSVLQRDGTFKEFKNIPGYTQRLWNAFTKYDGPETSQVIPQDFVTSKDVSLFDHISTQRTAQKWVDSAISKTINIPPDLSFEEFQGVYQMAYDYGLKGITTYRKTKARGSVIRDAMEKIVRENIKGPFTKGDVIDPKKHITDREEGPEQFVVGVQETHDAAIEASKALEEGQTKGPNTLEEASKLKETLQPAAPLSADEWKRPKAMKGTTYKLKWPAHTGAIYMTITDDGTRAWEVFIACKNADYLEWFTAITRMISAIMRLTPDITFLTQELQEVTSVSERFSIDQRLHQSLVALIGYTIEQHIAGLSDLSMYTRRVSASEVDKVGSVIVGPDSAHGWCDQCKQWGIVNEEGCKKCVKCGYSNCS